MTEGDKISVRFMRQDFFEFKPKLLLLIADNTPLSLRGVGEAMQRRLHLVPFTVTIPPAERNPDLQKKLRAELPAILSWLVDGYLEWKKQGLNPPESVLDATGDYLEDEDELSESVATRCEVGRQYAETSIALFNSRLAWAQDNSGPTRSRKAFSKALAARCFRPARKRTERWFHGLRLAGGGR